MPGTPQRAATWLIESRAAAGAELRAGGQHDRLFYSPTVLGGVTPAMPAFYAALRSLAGSAGG